MLVAIDDGYSVTKIARFSGDGIVTASYPTEVVKGNVPSIGMIGGADSYLYYDENEGAFTVRERGGGDRIDHNEYHVSAYNRVMINHALAQTGPTQKVNLVVSVPVTVFFSSDSDRMVERRRKALTEFRVFVDEKKTQPIAEIESVSVMPEAVSAYFDFYFNDDLSVNEEIAESNVLVVDIGGRTTDITVVRAGGIVETQASASYTHGVNNLRKLVGQAISARTGVFDGYENSNIVSMLAREAIETLTNEGKALVRLSRNRVEDFTFETKEALANFSRTVADSVRRKIEDTAQLGVRIDFVALVGGGGLVLAPYLREFFEKSTFADWYDVKDPQFSNVRGMLKYAQAIDAETKE